MLTGIGINYFFRQCPYVHTCSGKWLTIFGLHQANVQNIVLNGMMFLKVYNLYYRIVSQNRHTLYT